MRKKEGYNQFISVRDMFAGGLSQSCKRMSIICEQLLTFIAGKMTPVMQITDVAVAFLLKKWIEATKAELRREKRGNKDFEAAAFEGNPNEMKSGAEDLMRILGRSWKMMREQDEDEQPERLLKAARMCGWLSYRADPVRKVLIRCDEEDWTKGRAEELPETSARHPLSWWDERYKWIDEEGEPRKPDIGTEIKVALRGQGLGIINYFLVLCCVHVFYFHCVFFCAFIGLFYRLHQHRELPFHSSPAA